MKKRKRRRRTASVAAAAHRRFLGGCPSGIVEDAMVQIFVV